MLEGRKRPDKGSSAGVRAPVGAIDSRRARFPVCTEAPRRGTLGVLSLRVFDMLGFRWPLLALLPFGLLAGCGPSGPKLHPLSGKVTFDGAPLSPKPGETAFVEFTADAKSGNTSPHLPRGSIGADGTFAVTTANQPGLEAGPWIARVV